MLSRPDRRLMVPNRQPLRPAPALPAAQPAPDVLERHVLGVPVRPLPRSAAARDSDLASVRHHQERAGQRLPHDVPFKAKLNVTFILILYQQKERQEPVLERNVLSGQPTLRARPRNRKAVLGLYRQKHGG